MPRDLTGAPVVNRGRFKDGPRGVPRIGGCTPLAGLSGVCFPRPAGMPANWPPAAMTRFDPAMGRGYRIGDTVGIPPGTGVAIGSEPKLIVNHGDISKVSRWKVTLTVTDPANNAPARDGARLRFVVTGKMENDTIPRRITVTLGQSGVIYTPGRSVTVAAYNPLPYALHADWQIDEVTAGISRWEDSEVLTAIDAGAEHVLDIPPFCTTLEVFAGAGTPAPTLRGYQGATIVNALYTEVLAVPRSGTIQVTPGLDYTLESGGLNQAYIVFYACFG